jgi:dTDP-4-amino-4,6-dideoxygalactose transaminase
LKNAILKVPLYDIAAQHQMLKAELAQAFDEVMETGAFVFGPHVAGLERDIADLCGSQYGLGVNSGTDALLLALVALGIGPGDEVITSPFTFVATVETICLAGATPTLADIDADTFNLDASLAADRITATTKAIMPVHLFGQLADMTAFSKIAVERNLRLIGDAAQAIGATHHGKPIGTWSDLTTLSFYPTKNLGGCGDGGMIVTDNAECAEKIRLFRSHGSGGSYFYKEIGYCSRLDGLQAALLRVKVKHLQRWNDGRRRNAALYLEQLGGLEEMIALPKTAPGNHHVYHQFTIRVRHGKRDALLNHLAARGIESKIFYPLALHLAEAYAKYGYREGDFPESERATQEVLSIPVHPELTETQVSHVIESIQQFYA